MGTAGVAVDLRRTTVPQCQTSNVLENFDDEVVDVFDHRPMKACMDSDPLHLGEGFAHARTITEFRGYLIRWQLPLARFGAILREAKMVHPPVIFQIGQEGTDFLQFGRSIHPRSK